MNCNDKTLQKSVCACSFFSNKTNKLAKVIWLVCLFVWWLSFIPLCQCVTYAVVVCVVAFLHFILFASCVNYLRFAVYVCVRSQIHLKPWISVCLCMACVSVWMTEWVWVNAISSPCNKKVNTQALLLFAKQKYLVCISSHFFSLFFFFSFVAFII